MSCIKKGNIKCTSCCEVIHVSSKQILNARKGRVTFTGNDHTFIFENWARMKRRVAKKKPYMFKEYSHKEMDFFKCKALVVGVGCSIYEKRGLVCKSYTKGG